MVDPNQLEMALLNLAVNARDAMPQGGPITIGTREEALAAGNEMALPPGRYVALSVTDRGEGMDEETLARATEPFFTTKGIGKGTGLGLSTVHGLAQETGGGLVLESRLGVGTTATLWLPVTEGDAAKARGTKEVSQPAGQVPALSVLAVDDDVLVLMNTAAMLEDLGHRVATAYSGKQALEILERGEKFDLVITDQAMPKMTGAELIETIRRQQPDLPVILATAYAELPAGVMLSVPKVTKPFLQEHLIRAIAEVMQGRDT
jgi:CheY-like chemotaxis protein